MPKSATRAAASAGRKIDPSGYGFLTVVQTAPILGGDSFWFESTHGHRCFNPGDTEAAPLWINTLSL